MKKQFEYDQLIEQGFGFFNEDGEWCWIIAQGLSAPEIEEAEHLADSQNPDVVN